jgi:arylsulfatase A-like enzyme
MTNGPRTVVVVLTDAQVWNALGAMGHPQVRTPNVDALVQDGGTLFRNAYACNGVCVPSRACLMTGRYPIAHGVVTNFNRLPPTEETMGALFSAAGYATGCFGKTHFGRDDRDMAREGWAESFTLHGGYNDWLRQQGVKTAYPEGKQIKSRLRYWRVGRSNIPADLYFENAMGDRAVDFIRAHRRGPFLCVYAPVAPHGPFTPPAPYDSLFDPAEIHLLPRFEGELDDKPPAFVRWVAQNQRYVNEEELRVFLAHVYGLIALVDDNVGKVVRALKEEGLYEDTLILFTSDHGDFGSRFGIFGKSWCSLDCVMRVPLVVRAPAAGRVRETDALAQTVDLLPTMLEYAGLATPAKTQGRSLLPLLDGRTTQVREAAFAYNQSEHSGAFQAEAMVRAGRWKLVQAHDFKGELYDIESDPWEVKNLIGEPQHRDVVAGLRERLLRWHVACSGGFYDPARARFWEDETAFYDETRFCGERLRKLGDSPT